MNHELYIALLEQENARLKAVIAEKEQDLHTLSKNVRASLQRAFKYLPSASKADADAQNFANTLELLDVIEDHQGGAV